MRILMTTDTVGGVWTYSLDLARALEPHGVEVVLASMGGRPSASQQAQADAIGNVRLVSSDYRLEWMEEPWDDVRTAGRWLLELEAEWSPDMIHLNGYAHGQLPFVAPIVVVGHSCVSSWFLAVKDEDAPLPAWRRYRDAVGRGICAANVVVAPTAAMLRCLDRHYGPLPRSLVIHNGRDPSNYRVAETKEPIVLAAGRLWDEAKNIAALADVAAHLPWRTCVAGDDRAPDGSAAAFDNVQMLGRLDEAQLADWYARAAIYALPARYEPFGLSALEAALSGCALVLGDIESLREVWGDAACFVPPNDRAALRATLDDLIADPAKRAAMGVRARCRAFAYSAERMAEDYLSLYRSLRRPKRRSPQAPRLVRQELVCES